jgi:hypothetical protein
VYRFELPAGPFRVRWSAPNWETRDSDQGTVVAGSTTTVDTVTLRTLANVPIAEWTITGTIRDGIGNPVAAASLLVGDVFNVQVAIGSTGAAGEFRIASTKAHADLLHVTASKTGHRTQETLVTCGPSCALTANFRLLRIVREWIDAPSTMQVGNVALLSLVDDYDDGSRGLFAPTTLSGDCAVVQVLPLKPDDNRTYVKAIAPGTTVLQILRAGPPLAHNIRVVP